MQCHPAQHGPGSRPRSQQGYKSTVRTHTGSLTKVILCPDQSELLPVASRTPPRTISARRHVGPQNSCSHAVSIVVPGVGTTFLPGIFLRETRHLSLPRQQEYSDDYSPPAIPHTPVSLSNDLDSPSPCLRLVTPDAIAYIRSPVESSMRTLVLILDTNQSGTRRMS